MEDCLIKRLGELKHHNFMVYQSYFSDIDSDYNELLRVDGAMGYIHSISISVNEYANDYLKLYVDDECIVDNVSVSNSSENKYNYGLYIVDPMVSSKTSGNDSTAYASTSSSTTNNYSFDALTYPDAKISYNSKNNSIGRRFYSTSWNNEGNSSWGITVLGEYGLPPKDATYSNMKAFFMLPHPIVFKNSFRILKKHYTTNTAHMYSGNSYWGITYSIVE